MFTILDGCCSAGGASMGYKQACDDLKIPVRIIGVDNQPQPNYPFEFIQMDLLTFLSSNEIHFDFIHFSPPCQEYSCSTNISKRAGAVYSKLLEDVLKLAIDQVTVIENVMPSPIRSDIVLRGDLFGLKVLKQRKFQVNNFFLLIPQIPVKAGTVKNGDFAQVVGNGSHRSQHSKIHFKHRIDQETVNLSWSRAMGITHKMTNNELAQAIPPAYTRYIGNQIFPHISASKHEKPLFAKK